MNPENKSQMTPVQRVMHVLIPRVNKLPNASELPISPQAQTLRDSLLTNSLDTNNPDHAEFIGYGFNQKRDIEIFKQRCAYDSPPPQTFRTIGQAHYMTSQNARIRFEKVSRHILKTLIPFIPLAENHLARQAWDATCGYDVLNIIDPKIDQKLLSEAPINASNWNNLQNLDQVPTRISQSLDQKTKTNLISILNHLFAK